MIFNIQRYSTHDGEGVRTLIFYKGCPLRCRWCSNPESQPFSRSIMFDSRNCRQFGDCSRVAGGAISMDSSGFPLIRREYLSEPETLRDVCASKALSVSGMDYSPEELLEEVRKDLPFYRQGGGVTLSGGEPLAQGKELTDLLQRLQEENIGCNMETSLHVRWELVERTIGLVTTYLVDLKHTDTLKFREFTDGSSDLVMDNLKKLASRGMHIIVRIPVIPGFNHSKSEIFGMLDFISDLKEIREIHFLPYHSLGKEKYGMLGIEYTFNGERQIGEEELQPYVQYAEKKGYVTKIGG